MNITILKVVKPITCKIPTMTPNKPIALPKISTTNT